MPAVLTRHIRDVHIYDAPGEPCRARLTVGDWTRIFTATRIDELLADALDWIDGQPEAVQADWHRALDRAFRRYIDA